MAEFQGCNFPAKPKEKGSLGRTIALRVNHYRVVLNKPLTVFQYDVALRKNVHQDDGPPADFLIPKETMRFVGKSVC